MDKAVESKVSELSERVAGDVNFFLAVDICNLEQLKLLEKNAAATAPLQNEVASLLRLPPPDRFSADFMNAVVRACDRAGSEAAQAVRNMLREAAELERYLPRQNDHSLFP